MRCVNGFCGDKQYYEALKHRNCQEDEECEVMSWTLNWIIKLFNCSNFYRFNERIVDIGSYPLSSAQHEIFWSLQSCLTLHLMLGRDPISNNPLFNESLSLFQQLLTGEMCCYDLHAAKHWGREEIKWSKKCCNNPTGHPVVRPTRQLSQDHLRKVEQYSLKACAS